MSAERVCTNSFAGLAKTIRIDNEYKRFLAEGKTKRAVYTVRFTALAIPKFYMFAPWPLQVVALMIRSNARVNPADVTPKEAGGPAAHKEATGW
jgi:hypothetical protein